MKFFILILCLVTCAYGQQIKLNEKYSLNTKGLDTTFQVLPESDLKEKILCLWKGEDLQSILLLETEDHEGPLKKYYATLKLGLVMSGAKDVSFKELKTFKVSSGELIQPVELHYSEDGEVEKQIWYIHKNKNKMSIFIATSVADLTMETLHTKTSQVIKQIVFTQKK